MKATNALEVLRSPQASAAFALPQTCCVARKVQNSKRKTENKNETETRSPQNEKNKTTNDSENSIDMQCAMCALRLHYVHEVHNSTRVQLCVSVCLPFVVIFL